METECYTSRPLMQFARQTFISVLLFSLFFPTLVRGDELNDAAQRLARQMMSRAGMPAAIALTVNNLSSLDTNRAAEVRRVIETQLKSQRVQLVAKEQAIAEAEITISENNRGLLLVAEVRQGATRQVSMVAVPRPETNPAPRGGNIMTLRKTLLWSQSEPVLDVAVPGPDGMLLLTANSVTLFHRDAAGHWQPQQEMAVSHVGPWPRDLRGRLMLRSDHLFDAYLPGLRCISTDKPALRIDCHQTDDPWPLITGSAQPLSAFFSSTRNFYNGIVVTGPGQDTNVPPFFSAAGTAAAGGPEFMIFAGVDGQVRVFGASAQPLASWSGWGSDLASVKSACGSGRQLLAGRSGEATKSDVISAYEIANAQAVSVAAPLETGGPVTGLWTWSDGTSATAVIRNLSTGNYEAYALTLACNQ